MLVAGLLVLTAAACGDDANDGGGVGSAGSFEHPTGADDVVLRVGFRGGFMAAESAFLDLPTLLVSGDGRLFVQGPVAAIFPGPLMPNVQVRTVSEAGIQQLLQLAADNGLLAEREYAGPTDIADAPDTVVQVTADGETFEHAAYALGVDSETDEPRKALADFVTAAGAWVSDSNPELGAEQASEPDAIRIRAMPVTDLTGYEIEPAVVPWPGTLPALADASNCIAIPAAEVTALFADANQLTFFQTGDTVYQVTPKQRLPGSAC